LHPVALMRFSSRYKKLVNFSNLIYLSIMYRSIIHNNDRLWAWIWVAVRENTMFNEIFKCFAIDSATNNTACQVSVDCECRKETDVLSPLCRHFGDDRNTFLPPPVSSLTELRVDPGFVDKNKLIGSPFRELDKPVLPENRITFFGFLLELSISRQSKKTNLFTVDIFLGKKTT
jgi:hypothetical protein